MQTISNIFHFLYNYKLNTNSKITLLQTMDSSSVILPISHTKRMHQFCGCFLCQCEIKQEIIIKVCKLSDSTSSKLLLLFTTSSNTFTEKIK